MVYKSAASFWKLFYIALISLLTISLSNSQLSDANGALYLGQTPPGSTPEIFAEGIVSTEEYIDYGCTFSPDGTEFYFSRGGELPYLWPQILVMKLVDGVWTDPEMTSFSNASYEYLNMEPFITYDNKRLFYCSLRPLDGSDEGHIWTVDRLTSGWSEPYSIGEPINNHTSMYLTISENGTVYYTGPNEDIYSCTFKNGIFSTPARVGSMISSEYNDAHPFIAKDESYLLFDSNRPGGFGGTDIYICFKLGNGSWSNPVNLGENLNTSTDELTAYVSPDGKYFFYCSRRDIYWVSSEILRSLAPLDISIEKVKFKPKQPEIGRNIKLTATLLNKGNYYSAASDLSVYLSPKKRINKKSILLGTVNVASLKPGRKSRFKITSTLPVNLKQKGYYLIVRYDEDDRNMDPNLDDNSWISNAKVMSY